MAYDDRMWGSISSTADRGIALGDEDWIPNLEQQTEGSIKRPDKMAGRVGGEMKECLQHTSIEPHLLRFRPLYMLPTT